MTEHFTQSMPNLSLLLTKEFFKQPSLCYTFEPWASHTDWLTEKLNQRLTDWHNDEQVEICTLYENPIWVQQNFAWNISKTEQ